MTQRLELRSLPLRLARCVTVALALLSPSLLRAQELDLARVRDSTEYHVLATARTFGYGGWRTFAFRRVLEQPAADAMFKDLLTQASLAGQLYALCGLWFTDQETFEDEVERYRHIKEPLADGDPGGRGGLCGVGDEEPPAAGRYVWNPHPDTVLLDAPSDSVDAWRQRHDGRKAVLDIRGGGWPDLLAGRSRWNKVSSDPETRQWEANVERILRLLQQGEVPWLEDPPKDIDQSDEDDERNATFLAALGRYRGAPPQAVLATLDHDDPAVRRTTLYALTGSGPYAADVADRLVQALFEDTPELRNTAYRTLNCVGPWATKAFPVIEERLANAPASDDVDTRPEVLFSTNEHAAASAHDMLSARLVERAAPDALPSLRRLLQHPHAAIRLLIVEGLARNPHIASRLAVELERLLADPVVEVRAATARTIGNRWSGSVWHDKTSTLGAVQRTFESDPNDTVRVAAAVALRTFGSSAHVALPVLTRALDATSLGVRVGAAYARWDIARVGPQSVPALLAHLESGDLRAHREELSRSHTLEILVALAADERAAEDLEAWLLADPEGSGRGRLVRALGNAGLPPPGPSGKSHRLLPVFEVFLAHSEPGVGIAAAFAIEQLTGNAEVPLDYLMTLYREMLEDENFLQAPGPLRKLCRLGPRALPALGLALDVVYTDAPYARVLDAALDLVTAIGPDVGQDGVQALLDLAARQRSAGILNRIAKATGAIGTPARTALPLLFELLDHERSYVRETSRQAIEKIVAALREAEHQRGY